MKKCFTISAAIFDNGSISCIVNSDKGSSCLRARASGSKMDAGVETGVVRPVLGCDPKILLGILSVTFRKIMSKLKLITN